VPENLSWIKKKLSIITVRCQLIRRSLLAVLFRELFGIFRELFFVFQVLFGQIGPERVLRFRFVDEGHQRLDHLIRLRGRLPVLGADYREAHLSFFIYVRMVYLRFEVDFRRLKRIFGRKIYLYFKRALIVRRVILKKVRSDG
jgi:hypothetical protein